MAVASAIGVEITATRKTGAKVKIPLGSMTDKTDKVEQYLPPDTTAKASSWLTCPRVVPTDLSSPLNHGDVGSTAASQTTLR